jgi:tetratricopeptide (TPR) repeat protein
MTFFNFPTPSLLLLVWMMIFTSTISTQSQANEQNSRLITKNAHQKMDQYFAGDVEELAIKSSKEAITLSEHIINKPSLYTATTQAKAYNLVAEVYTQRNNIKRATNMAQKGLALKNVELTTQLHLSLKVAVSFLYDEDYDALMLVTDKIVSQAKQSSDKKVYLLALSYRALGYALTKQYALAYKNLNVIEGIINRNTKYAEHFALLDAVAQTYTALGDYSQALIMRQKILHLRFSLARKIKLAKTYYNLGQAYQGLGRLNNAYNAYWESNFQAKMANDKKDEVIAQLALGHVLVLQHEYVEAYQVFDPLYQFFTKNSQFCEGCYVEATIGLAHASLYTERAPKAYLLLDEALILLQGKPVGLKQVEFYRLLSLMYRAHGKYKQAFNYLMHYMNLKKEHNTIAQEKVTHHASSQAKAHAKNQDDIINASQLAESYEEKFIFQEQIIFLLSLLLFSLFASTGMYVFHHKTKLLHRRYEEIERPVYYLDNAEKTKKSYKQHFKMSRKYEYSLSLGYISVDNWQELSLRFNKKNLAEIHKGIATIINGNICEFDSAGLINQGEYLVLYPHQSLLDVEIKFKQLKDILGTTLFANLGDFPVNICFSLDEPGIQDIDPYIFLSRLSDKAVTKFQSNKYE